MNPPEKSSHSLPREADLRLSEKTSALELPSGKSEVIIFDDDLPGFGVRLRAGGSRTWIFQFKLGEKQRRVTIGSAKAISAAQARKTATDFHARVHLGQDPGAVKAEGKLRAAETMDAALRLYLPYQKARLKPGSYSLVERHLLVNCKPLHGAQLALLDRRAVAGRISAIAAKNGPIAANRTRASLAAFFHWAQREGLATDNPAAFVSRQAERSRERVLTDEELRVIWTATAGGSDYDAVIRLLMLTACRIAEIGSLRCSELVDDRIVLPASRTKNGREHIVPLSAPALDIITQRERRTDRDFIFGRRHGTPLTGWSALKAALDERCGAKMKSWTHHDLRRTAATRMGEIGILPHVIEAVLNHTSGHKHGVAGIYNRATYEPGKAIALARWSDHLLRIVGGREGKVIPLRA
jgi:integrase